MIIIAVPIIHITSIIISSISSMDIYIYTIYNQISGYDYGYYKYIYIYRHPGVHRIWKFEKTHYKNGNGVKKLVFFTSGLLYNYIQLCVYVYIYMY